MDDEFSWFLIGLFLGVVLIAIILIFSNLTYQDGFKAGIKNVTCNTSYGQIQPQNTSIDYKPIECFNKIGGEWFYNLSCG